MRPLRFSDFSGGLSEIAAPDDFGADSVAAARGFVVDSPVTFRSQWPLQQFDGTDFTAIRSFTSNSQYLVGVKSNGTVWWTVAPAVDAPSPTLSWTQFGSVASQTSYRFIGEIPYQASKQTITNTVDGDTVETQAVLYGKNGLLLNSNTAGVMPVVVYESGSNTLTASAYSKVYPAMVAHPSIANLNIPDTGVMPRANVGVVWGDRLVLADIQWYAATGTDQALADASVTRYRNAMWFSESGAVDTFDPLSVVVPCSSEAQIVDLAVIDLGLLVMTTSASGRDGLILLRGSPGNFSVEVLRSGLSMAARTTNTHRYAAANWTDTGTVVFVNNDGAIWQTNGTSVLRLDGLTLAPYGPAVENDHCAAVGPWLFVVRGQRLLVMRVLGEAGAWTELVPPTQLSVSGSLASVQDITTGTAAVSSLTALAGSMWFLSGGVPHRFAVGYGSGPRGHFGALPIAGLRVDSATAAVDQGGDNAHRRALWHRFGVRARGRSNAKLVSLSTLAGPALTSPVGFTSAVDEVVGSRYEKVVQAGIGFASEASGRVVFQGDVELESMTFWVSGGEPVR